MLGIKSLKKVLDAIYEEHTHARILFITPEAVGSINTDNAVIKAELEKLCTVDHIVQTDALNFPNFTIYTLCVLGTNSGTPWSTDNLADVKTVPMLPILCFDKVAAAYLEMGTDGGDATTKTTIDVSAKIEASVLGMGSHYKAVTGLVAGVQTISTSATYHTLDMSHANLSEVVYATANIDVDVGNGGTPQTDVVLGLLPGVLEDGTIGLDEEGEELPATLAFFGAGYDASALNTLGKAIIYLVAHILIHAATKPLEIAGTIMDLRRLLIGNMAGQFGNTTPLVEWLVGQNTAGTKPPAGVSLYDVLDMMRGLIYVGTVTAVEDTTHFTVGSLAGKGANFFKPTAGSPYEILVIEADGAAPLGQIRPVGAYTTGTGEFEHTAWTTNAIEEGDIVALIHPKLASLGDKSTTAHTGAVDTVTDKMGYVKQLVTELQVVDGLADDIKAVTDEVYMEQLPDEDVNETVTATESECVLVSLAYTDGKTYCLRYLRVKCADPGVGRTVTVKLYERWNDAITQLIDNFDITPDNYGTYNSLMDMFGVPEIHSDAILIRAVHDGASPADDKTIEATYRYAETT